MWLCPASIVAKPSRLGSIFVVLIGFGPQSLAAPLDPPRNDQVPTYTKDIAPILQAKCQSCHRKGQVAPFCLETYDQARKRASDLASVTEGRSMPPWKPAPGVGPKFKHDRSLAAGELATLRKWADAGAPLGEEKHRQPAAKFAEGWALGTPDLILSASEDFSIPATGPDTYRCFAIPTNLAKNTYLSAIEYRPGNPRVVHHMSAFLDTKGCGRVLDEIEPGPGYTSFAGPGFDPAGQLGFWAAGNVPMFLPEGIGYAIPKKADLLLQIHYHPSGKPETDRTEVGFYFAKKPIKQVLHWNDASAYGFRLPAGKSDTEVSGTWFVPTDVEALAIAPHMHQLGREIRMTATDPKGKSSDLIHIPDWDPGWQETYFFEKPITMVRGTILTVEGRFDNSAHNRNPNNPPKTVRWGHGVHDEMCVGYIAVVKKGQDLTKAGESDDLFQTFQKQRMSNLRRAISKQAR